MHSRILRSELVAACPVIFALMILIVVGRRASVARPLGMALAAALCVLGLENKVQAILLIGALPLLILPFGSAAQRKRRILAQRAIELARPPARGHRGDRGGMGGVAARSPPASIARLLDAAQFHPLLLGRFGIYQAALLVLIGGCMIAYAAIWRVSAAETLASMAAIAAGASIALLAARSRIQRQQRDRRVQSAGKDADLCRCQHHRCRQRLEPVGNSVAAARRVRIGAGALQLRAALLAASDGVSDLADRPRHRRMRGGAAKDRPRSRRWCCCWRRSGSTRSACGAG